MMSVAYAQEANTGQFNARPGQQPSVQPNASMRQGQNADVNGHVNGRANATVRRWNVAHGGPYYDYVPGIMASV